MATTGQLAPDRPASRRRLRRPGTRLLAAIVLVLVVAGAILVVTDPFGGGGSGNASYDSSAATSLVTVVRRSLSSQTQVSGTLGYADASTIAVPGGTAQSALRQAQQSLAGAESSLRTAQATLATDQKTLDQAQAKLAADRQQQAADCAGANAAQSASNGNGNGGGGGSSTPCASAAQAVASDQQAVTTAQQKVATDQGQVSSAQTALASAQQNLAAAESSATTYDTGSSYTMLPQVGQVIRRGHALYAIADEPALLLYGSVPAWRAFRVGMSPGRDVAQLNANLRALGYGSGLSGNGFTSATEQAILALQRAHGVTQSGVLPLGSVVFEPGAVRVTSVTPTVGSVVQPGPVLGITSTRHLVTIALDAAQQSEIKVGDPVTVTLPDNSTTAGTVSYVGSVATTPSSSDQGNGGSSTPTIEVDVRLSHEAAAGNLDQAPVDVSITTASVKSVLVVPVNALLALASGGYAVETVDSAGVHRLVGVSLGIFDDAEGLVQVSGALNAGQRVVVPAS